MKQLHLHLLSDSTGETLDMLAKACLAQFDTVEAIPHLWPMVRSEGHLDRVLDAAYFARVDAIQFTIAHDDGVGPENWEEADIILAGVSRTSKTPTSIYLANRGYKVANVPLVPQSPPPAVLFSLKHPLIVGLTTNPERLVQIRRNRLLSLNQAPETDYVDPESVNGELAFARRLFADNGWAVIDVTRRSIEESALAIVKLYGERLERAAE